MNKLISTLATIACMQLIAFGAVAQGAVDQAQAKPAKAAVQSTTMDPCGYAGEAYAVCTGFSAHA